MKVIKQDDGYLFIAQTSDEQKQLDKLAFEFASENEEDGEKGAKDE